MGIKTEIIKFNVKERYRKYRGVDRNFDTVALANLINSGAVQERVKHGDMVGYFGHWVREKFGMMPKEGAIVDGKQVALEPAVRTVYLKAYPNGDIEHQQEFLNTKSGLLSERLHKSKAYGFSSAVQFNSIRDLQVPYSFCGFDFVGEPNFSGNRGYDVAFDSVDDVISEFDSVAEHNNLIDSINAMFDAQENEVARLKRELEDVHKMYSASIKAFDSVNEENAELYSMLSQADKDEKDNAFDSVTDLLKFNLTSKFDKADAFADAELVGFEESEEKAQPVSPAAKIVGKLFDSIAKAI